MRSGPPGEHPERRRHRSQTGPRQPGHNRGNARYRLGVALTRGPESLPFPDRPAGSDCLPGIDYIVVLMKENHSYDNYFGMLERGDGFTFGPDGSPLNSNPDQHGKPGRAPHSSPPLNLSFHLNQTWNDSHRQWGGGKLDGFV